MAAAFRHWSREGYVEGISGHISVGDPEHHDAFWTNPLRTHVRLLKASDMILVDLDGRIVGRELETMSQRSRFFDTCFCAQSQARCAYGVSCVYHSWEGVVLFCKATGDAYSGHL